MKNFKVRCVDSKVSWWAKDEIYKVVNGTITDEDGDEYDGFTNMDELNNRLSAIFELIDTEVGVPKKSVNFDYISTEDLLAEIKRRTEK